VAPAADLLRKTASGLLQRSALGLFMQNEVLYVFCKTRVAQISRFVKKNLALIAKEC
jgi:hypothetical protein